MFGFYGRFIMIDLSKKSFCIKTLSDELLSSTLGGKGLATYLLNKMNPLKVNPLAPDNHIIVAIGPFCNSFFWGSSRYGVYTKSPLTNRYAESYSGGKVPEAIDSTGFDAIVFKGCSKKPCVVTVHPDGASFFDAQDLWRTNIFEAEKQAVKRFSLKRKEYNNPGAIVIGPAGENQVRFAMIANDKWRCAGRTGTGAVLGSKNLKAIVFHGNSKRTWADIKGIKAYAKEFSKNHIKSPAVQAYNKMGTTMMVGLMNTIGAFPAKYWNLGRCDHWEKISGETYHKEHKIKPHACAKCFMACGRMATISKGRYKGLTIEGPEYETIYAFGGLCMVEDIADIAYLNDLCDRLGIDTITTGNLCGLIMEAKEKKRIDYDLKYGDTKGIECLIKKIVKKEGIGKILSKGILVASKELGLKNIAIHVKGLEPAGYDPRVLKGMGLAFATSARGACHLRTTFYKAEISGMIPSHTIEKKAEKLVDFEDRLNIFDSMILCRFYRDLYPWEELQETIALATGISFSEKQLRKIAESILTGTRQFNLNQGLVDSEDNLPERFYKQPLPSGHKITKEEMQKMLADYYKLRGFSP